MSFVDNIRRRFAVTGSNPSYKEDDPRSFGAGVIKRLKINKGYGGFNQIKDYEPHLGKNRTYMNVYLSDPIYALSLIYRAYMLLKIILI